ncbi:leucine-rich repeat protein SHOC-2-like [Sycon ciliatum]|uniref:leucine-rich repeat protein SHOC-2-like n=1 Tax=Sycon ciliatum TaxID=27933 RepID=UPI0020A8915F|eukprot:scpid30504/ scgid12514/ Leucine-rich repeat protein soc-2 homolog; Protein Sur-8 homolog; Protein soc-2 homolog
MESSFVDWSSLELCKLPEDDTVSSTQTQRLNLDFNEFVQFPTALSARFPSLTELNICGNDLKSLSEAVASLPALETLRVDENQLTSLPDALCDLHKLKLLSLVGNDIVTLPEKFGFGLQCLEEFIADENGLETFPKSFCSLGKLRRVQISHHRMCSLPEQFGNLSSLEAVDLSHGRLKELPASIDDLARLCCLDVSHNQLETVMSSTASSGSLRVLHINNNHIREMPRWLDTLSAAEEINIASNRTLGCPFSEAFAVRCQSLERLLLGENSVDRLPQSLGQLKNLRYLHLGSVISEIDRWGYDNGNWIEELPESFGELQSLERLEAHETRLHRLPESFGSLSLLEHADFTNSLVASLPNSFHNLSSLSLLKLSRNRLTVLPENFGLLPCLQELYLDDNQISSLPVTMANMSSLHTLDLFKNNLQQYPDVLSSMSSLRELDMSSNPFFDELPEGVQVNRVSRNSLGLPSRWKTQALHDQRSRAPNRGLVSDGQLEDGHGGSFDAPSATAQAPTAGAAAPSPSPLRGDTQVTLRDSHAQAYAKEQRRLQQAAPEQPGVAVDDDAAWHAATAASSRDVNDTDFSADDDIATWQFVELEANYGDDVRDDCLDAEDGPVASIGAGYHGGLFGKPAELDGDYVENIDLPGDLRDYTLRASDVGLHGCVFRHAPPQVAFKDCYWQPTPTQHEGDGVAVAASVERRRARMVVLHPRHSALQSGFHMISGTKNYEELGIEWQQDPVVNAGYAYDRGLYSVSLPSIATLSLHEPWPAESQWTPDDPY